MKQQELKDVFSSFNKKTVLIVGDAMIDDYLWGEINRTSPEAPVPIVDIDKYESRLGGAANCALNIKELGAKPILCTVIGNDINGNKFKKLIKESKLSSDGIMSSSDRKTTVKKRIICEGKHQLRIDEEDKHGINNEDDFLEKISSLIKNVSVVILQDYNKGVLTKYIITEVIKLAKQKMIPIIVDPKKDNFFSYIGCDIFKPNLKEIKDGMKIDFDQNSDFELEKVTSQLKKKISAKGVLLTLSENGLCINSNEGFIHTPSYLGKVVDVSGAGDTVISVASLLISEDISFQDISKISSLSGGIVCQKVGVVPIQKEELLSESLKLFN